jgi:hypothetical protein
MRNGLPRHLRGRPGRPALKLSAHLMPGRFLLRAFMDHFTKKSISRFPAGARSQAAARRRFRTSLLFLSNGVRGAEVPEEAIGCLLRANVVFLVGGLHYRG